MHILESKVFNAIRQSQYKQLALFIRHNYNLNVTTADGRNGLFVALDISDARKRRRMLRFCLDNGIDALQRDRIHRFTAVHEAIARQQVDSVQLLLANASGEIDWRAFDSYGRTILHQAVESNNSFIVEAIVMQMNHYGISVDMPDKNGLTPYLLAKKLRLRDIADILLHKGHASRQQHDLLTHRNANDWETIGFEENRLFLRDRLRREIDSAMTEGKINRVKTLKQLYSSSLLTHMPESARRDSILSMTTISGANMKSSMSINEMIDQLSDGEIPEAFVSSESDSQLLRLEHVQQHAAPISLPPISTARKNRPNVSLNNLVDLFQVATDQISQSYRSSSHYAIDSSTDQQIQKQTSTSPHRSTLASMKSTTNLPSTPKLQQSSNTIISTKRHD